MSSESHWEKLKYFFVGDEPEYEKTWVWASFVYAAVANWLAATKFQSMSSQWSQVMSYVDQKWFSYANTGISWQQKYIDNLLGIYSETNLGNSAYAKAHAIKTPSFFIGQGFSNAKEFYAWGAFVLAWAGTVKKDDVLLSKSQDYISAFLKRPSDVSRNLWKTPTTKNDQRQQEFSEAVLEFAESKYYSEIQPFLLGAQLGGIRAFLRSYTKRLYLCRNACYANESRQER